MVRKIDNRRDTFFKVQDNIPIPLRRRCSKYEWDKLTKEGQSVFLHVNSRRTFYASLSKYRKRIKEAVGVELNFTAAKWQQEDAGGREVYGYRVWLIEINKPEAVA